jgi:Tfp pilus assembly pilus retraction ATPase PilT
MQTLDQCLTEMVRQRLVSADEARTYAANKDIFGAGMMAAGATLGGGAAGGKR